MATQAWKRHDNSIGICFTVSVSAFFLFYSLVMLLPGSSLLQDPDTFWHISIGQWILSHTQFPTVDVYSYTAAGKPYISTEWLSQVLLAATFELGAWRAVVILTALSCATIIAALCFYLARYLRLSVVIGSVALIGSLVSVHFLARPHIFSYVFLVIWMIKLIDAYDGDGLNLKSAFVFVPLMVFWANFHGSFTFGLAMFYIFVGFTFYEKAVHRRYTDCWQLFALTVVVSLSGLVTPYGIQSALTTKELLDLKYANTQIVELHATDFQRYIFHLGLLTVLITAAMGFGIKLRGPRLIGFALIFSVGLSYTRGLVMFFLIAPLILAKAFSDFSSYLKSQSRVIHDLPVDDSPDPIFRYLNKWPYRIPVICGAIAVAVTGGALLRSHYEPPNSIAPRAALDFVRNAGIKGNVFNDYDFGGYLIFSGIPTFVDGRSLPFGDKFLRKYFDAESLTDPQTPFELFRKYNVNWILLRPAAPLAKLLAVDDRWNERYSDRYSVVFTRRQ